MNILIILAHPERKSFNGALFDAAVRTSEATGHTVATSDLYRMGFNPVSDRGNFVTVKDPDYLKDAAKLGIDVSPIDGNAILKMIENIADVPSEQLKSVEKFISGG